MFVGVLFICYEISVWLYPPMLAWGLGVIGRNPICDSFDSLHGAWRPCGSHSGENRISSRIPACSRPKKSKLVADSGRLVVPKRERRSRPQLSRPATRDKIYGEGLWGVQKGDVVLDAGANIGVYTREALDEGASLVIAVEPGPENVACLRRNFQREIEEKRVIVEAIGVWDKDDVLPLYADPLNSGADSFVIRGPNDHVTHVPLTSIDKLVSQLQLRRIDYIKMDIKGPRRRHF